LGKIWAGKMGFIPLLPDTLYDLEIKEINDDSGSVVYTTPDKFDSESQLYRARPISSHLDRTSLSIKDLLYGLKHQNMINFTCGTKPVSRAGNIAQLSKNYVIQFRRRNSWFTTLITFKTVAASEHQGRMGCKEKSRPKKIPIQRIFYGDQNHS